MRPRRQRSRRQRRVARRVNAWVLAGYAVLVVLTALLKAWEIAYGEHPIGRLAKTNAIIWDTVTLAATLGALALGVREMVLAYFMRKEYEEDLDALLRNQEAQAEMVKAQAEAAFRREQAEWDAAQIQQLTNTVQQLI